MQNITDLGVTLIVTESENSLDWKRCLSSSHSSSLPRAVTPSTRPGQSQPWSLNTCRDGAFPASLCNLCQCLSPVTVRKFFLISSPWLSLLVMVPCAPVCQVSASWVALSPGWSFFAGHGRCKYLNCLFKYRQSGSENQGGSHCCPNPLCVGMQCSATKLHHFQLQCRALEASSVPLAVFCWAFFFPVSG